MKTFIVNSKLRTFWKDLAFISRISLYVLSPSQVTTYTLN